MSLLDLGYGTGTNGTATQASIRDRIMDLLEAFDPQTEIRVKLRRHRNEDDGDFLAWCESNPTACFRRFQVDDESYAGPESSNTDVDMRETIMRISVAYPHGQRFGNAGATARRTVIEQDFGEIEKLVGIYARAWYFNSHDCTPLGIGEPQFTIERGNGFDILSMSARFSYYRYVQSIA